MKKTNKKGFTIVELVIVIAVIAILAAVLIPTFSGVVAKANASAALQEATSAMKSTLAMSQTGTLADNTIFAIGNANAVTYMFKYEGNKINETAVATIEYVNGGTTSDGVKIDRIIVNSKAVEGKNFTNATKIKAIIEKSLKHADTSSYSIALSAKNGIYKADGAVKGENDTASSIKNTDTGAAYDLVITKTEGDTTTLVAVLAVYTNSDYPTDLVTFVPATKSTTAN